MFVCPRSVVRIVIVAMPAPSPKKSKISLKNSLNSSPSASLPPLPKGEAWFVHPRSVVRFVIVAIPSWHDTQVVPYKDRDTIKSKAKLFT